MLRQSFNLPVEPVKVVDEKEKVNAEDQTDGGKKRGNNMGYITEIIFPICAASYIMHDNIDTDSTLHIIANGLNYDNDAYEIDVLLDPNKLQAAIKKNAANDARRATFEDMKGEIEDHLIKRYYEWSGNVQSNKLYKSEFKDSHGNKFYVVSFKTIGANSREFGGQKKHTADNIKLINKIIPNGYPEVGYGFERSGVEKIRFKNDAGAASPMGIFYKFNMFNTNKEYDSINELVMPTKQTINFKFRNKDGDASPYLPKAQEIIRKKDGEYKERFLELRDVIETLRINMKSIPELRSLREIYKKYKESETPLNIDISQTGDDGMSKEGKGHVKGDVRITFYSGPEDEKRIIKSETFSLKYETHKVASFNGSVDVLAKTVREAIVIAELSESALGVWDKYTKSAGSFDALFNLLEKFLKDTSGGRRIKMMFAFLERFAHGSDQATLLRIGKMHKDVHTVPAMIAQYLKYRNREVEIERDKGSKTIRMIIVGDDGTPYGILKLANHVEIDGELSKFLHVINEILSDDTRMDMWRLVKIRGYLNSLDKKTQGKRFGIAHYKDLDSFKADFNTIIQKYVKEKASLSSTKEYDDISPEAFIVSPVYKFMMGDEVKLDNSVKNSFIASMKRHILEGFAELEARRETVRDVSSPEN
jgi:hypothetical protein